MTRALVVGSGGQDGQLLFDRLTSEGHAALGLERTRVRCTQTHSSDPVDLLDATAVSATVARFQPTRIFYLAAVHHSAEERPQGDPELFKRSFDVHVHGLVSVLDAMRREAPNARLFYAASSHVFGAPTAGPQTEATPLAPVCAYGISKAAGLRCCAHYRRRGVYASAGILYNHESELRGERFLSQKVVRGAVAIAAGAQRELVLGDLSASIDWGYAADTVNAMLRILEQPEPDDFIVASGERHTVGEFARLAFEAVGLDWRAHVREDSELVSRQRRVLFGDASRLRERTGWEPSITFAEMVTRLVRAREAAQ